MNVVMGVILMVLIGNGAILVWIAITLYGLPQRTVNTRIIVAAIDQMRAAQHLIGETQALDAEALSKKLGGVIEMLDVYVLRIGGQSAGKRT